MIARPVAIFEPPSLARLRVGGALARLGHHLDLLRTLSVHRIKVRYVRSRLGLLWAMLQPLAMMLVFTAMFSFLGGRPSGNVPYPLFAYAALLPWTAFSSGLSLTSGALTGHAALLTKVAFPREILPITYVVAALVDLGIASIVLVAMMIWFGVALTPAALWALAAVALMAPLLLGLSLLVSALQVRFRDVGLALPILLQIWMFATPVLYPLAAAKHALSRTAYFFYILNPMSGIVETFRRGMILHQGPDVDALLLGAAVTAILLPIAYVYFKFNEQTLADVV